MSSKHVSHNTHYHLTYEFHKIVGVHAAKLGLATPDSPRLTPSNGETCEESDL